MIVQNLAEKPRQIEGHNKIIKAAVDEFSKCIRSNA
jgi:hypothetical protein